MPTEPRHILRHDDGQPASRSVYAGTEAGRRDANRAARRIAKRTGRTVEVWWCNEAGVPKVAHYRAEG